MINHLRKASPAGILFLLLLVGFRPGWSQSVVLASNFQQKRTASDQVTSRQLKDVLNDLKSQYGVNIMFELRTVDGLSVSPESINAKATLDKNLENLLRPVGLRFKKVNSNSYLILGDKKAKKIAFTDGQLSEPTGNLESGVPNESTERTPAVALLAVTKTETQATADPITGTVKSQTGEALPGINVVIKGTTKGTSTDANGKFTLDAPANSVLVLSGIGFVTQEVSINNRSRIDVSLVTDNKQLDEVVVVGFGTQKRNSLTNSIATISGEEVARRPVSNISQSLQGQLPGVTVLDQGGSPGRSSSSIRVRGITSFNINSTSSNGSGNGQFGLDKNDALVIVDGIEQRLQDLNPDDIETISILKDAASTAIYGSRATNGVVLVTTKRAKGSKVQVDYNGYYAIQNSINVPKPMGLEDYMRMQVVAYTNAGQAIPARFTEQSIQAYVNATDREKYPLPNTWFQTMLHAAPQQNHTISVAGGNETIRTRLSFRYQDQGGIITNYASKIGEIRLNSDYTISPTLRVSADINYRYNYSVAPPQAGGNDVINYFFHGSLWAVPKYADGSYGLSTQGNNPLMYAEIGGLNKQYTDYMVGSLKGEWDIMEGLTFSTQISGRGYFTGQKNYTNAYTDFDKNANITKTVANNTLTEVRNTLREYTLINLLAYEKRVGDHNFKGLLGYQQIGNTQTFLTAYRERFYNNDIQSISQGANDGTKTNSGNDAVYALRSYFGRVNYDYNGKYFAEANGRFDGSSKFTGAKQYSFFPSFSAGWRISKEAFWQGLDQSINDLKFRGSWGITGNQSVDLYSYYASLNASGYDLNGAAVQGYRQTNLANTNLGWESTTQLDLGLDASFLNRRMNFTVDYYRKLTSNILLNLDIPATVGLIAPPQNAGSVENKGWEFTLNYRGAKSASGFQYNLGGNFSINQNKVVDLKGTGPYITGSDIQPRYIIAVGLPINTLWGYQTAGLFQTQQEVTDYKATYAANTKPGDVKYVDRNGDGKIDSNDMTNIGNSFPKFTFGLNSSFSYKNFELNLLVQGAAKVDARLAGALAEMGNQEGFTHTIYTNNYWTPDHTDARFPRPLKFDLRNVATSDRMVIDASYVRVKNVQLAYSLPAAIASKVKLSRIRAYVSATNVFTLSKLNEWNLDPEVGSGRGVYYPQTSLYTLGLNLHF